MCSNIYSFSFILLCIPCIKLKYVHLAARFQKALQPVSKRMKEKEERKEGKKEGRKTGRQEKREENSAKVEFILIKFILFANDIILIF